MPIFDVLAARSNRKASKKTKQANELERRRAAISNVLARRQALAAVRRQRAQITASAVGSGLEGGSAARNTAGNIDTQATASIARNAQLDSIDQQINRLQQGAISRRGQADTFSAAGRFTDAAAKLVLGA